MYTTDTEIKIFLDALASNEPAPGGGGAAALAGAVGTALGNMVGSIARNRKNADVDTIDKLNGQATLIRLGLEECIKKDAEVFLPLSNAYSMPAETGEQKREKSAVLEECLFDAAMVPVEIAKLAVQGIMLTHEYYKICPPLLLSDIGCSAAILEGAVKAATLNVYVNTRLMKDREKADLLNSTIIDMEKRAVTVARKLHKAVKESLTTV